MEAVAVSDDLDAYGPKARALLLLARPHFAALNDGLVIALYKELARHAQPDDAIARLTPEHYWAVQQQNPLHHLFDPDPKRHAHQKLADQAGRKHAFLGIESAWLVDAYEQHLKKLLHHLQRWSGKPEDHALLRPIITTRLMANLSAEIAGQHEILRGQQRVVATLMRLLETPATLSDLARSLLDSLISLEGMVAGTLARPDENGTLQYETVVGKTYETHASWFADQQLIPNIHKGSPQGDGPSGRAWRSGHVQQSLFIPSDPTTAPWHELAQKLGYASLAAIPIRDTEGRPQGILALYHESPGYFATPDRVNLLDCLCSVLGAALTRLTHNSPIVSYATRTDYRERLVQEHVTMLYQPVIDLTTGRLQKVEALARLDNADGSYVSPGEFLPAFGGRELRQLFAFGLRQALTDLRHWEAHGLTTSVAINLPPQALVDYEYLAVARTILHDIPIDTTRLTLELLETDEIDHRQNPTKILAEWRALGIRLAQDDLGSGYSSLLRMENLAVDDVKIDQGLVSTAAQTPRKALQFIHHLTRLVHDLGIHVVVEGLGSLGLIEAAAILGADAGQGYAIARPMTAAALRPWTRHFRFTVDPNNPQTALGAYANMLLQNALITFVEMRPNLLRLVIAEPCALSRYIHLKGLGGARLGDAYKEFQALANKGTNTARYRNARQNVEDQLCAQIQREETTPPCTLTHDHHLYKSHDNGQRPRKTPPTLKSKRPQQKQSAL